MGQLVVLGFAGEAAADEVLVRMMYGGICGSDLHF